MTLSPEYDNALSFIEALTKANVVVALGHTAATPNRIREAIAAGARLATHLGNGCHASLPRHDNYLWEQLAADGLWASLIADGHHLPAAVLRSILRVKTPARLVLTCDASSLAGMPPGRYAMWGQELEVTAGGRVGVPGTPFLAGSGAFLDACIDHLLGLGEVSLEQAVDMAGAQPRDLLRLPPARLTVGASGRPRRIQARAGTGPALRRNANDRRRRLTSAPEEAASSPGAPSHSAAMSRPG